MNVKFTHYLITRYNVRLDQWERDALGQLTLHDDWMAHRFELFARYCFPSVIAQSEKNFGWLIYLESSTSRKHLEQITALVSPFPFIQIRLVSGYFGCMEDIDRCMTAATSAYVITSRMDNDDAIGVDYIKTVQLHFTPRDKTLIILLNGYGYNPMQHIATRLHQIAHNPFASFVEERKNEGGHTSVRGFPHGNPPVGTMQIEVQAKYSWMRIFHDRNLLSKPFGYPVFVDHFSDAYGIDKKYLKLNFIATLGYTFHWLWDGIGRKLKQVAKPKSLNQ